MKEKRQALNPVELVLRRLNMSAMALSSELGLGKSTVGSWRHRNGKIPNRGSIYFDLISLAGRKRVKLTLEEIVRGGSP